MPTEESGSELKHLVEDLKEAAKSIQYDTGEGGVEYVEVPAEELALDLERIQSSLIDVTAFCEIKVEELDNQVDEIVQALTLGNGVWKDRLRLAEQRRKTESIMPVVHFLTSICSTSSSDFSASQVSEDAAEAAAEAMKRYCNSLDF